jgi:hypothetical protein
MDWRATLVVANWNGNLSGGGAEQLKFGTSQAGLTPNNSPRFSSPILRCLARRETIPPGFWRPVKSANTASDPFPFATRLTLTWGPGWTLQCSTNVAGPYQDVRTPPARTRLPWTSHSSFFSGCDNDLGKAAWWVALRYGPNAPFRLIRSHPLFTAAMPWCATAAGPGRSSKLLPFEGVNTTHFAQCDLRTVFFQALTFSFCYAVTLTQARSRPSGLGREIGARGNLRPLSNQEFRDREGGRSCSHRNRRNSEIAMKVVVSAS